ncbi:Na+/H+ antiporter subunit E [Xylanibacillus composti]|uniref:Na+/H+ antiporter subunit E n=1 Tax=Xylanibacillus composti TaxID=1572762 RepID=A0A8J4H5K9_9BACL|nr:Na+/H+ antiporter subunit E [Xylanibacillus composti]MDT9725337.1 Na+/H+ antiporter subunit E [Xylanibacillus composti]GIQ69098.1 Na+/H+ antiporter subunit E [Xylanibacillus composti]
MAIQILLNLIIALLWMLLHDVWDSLTFAIGYLLGMLFIFTLRRFFPGPFYGKKVISIIKLFYLFNVELIKSSAVVIAQITRPRINIKPGVFRMETKLRGQWEITILCCLLTLTPGSVVLEVAPEDGVLYLHGMDVAEIEDMIIQTKTVFEEAIIEVMN